MVIFEKGPRVMITEELLRSDGAARKSAKYGKWLFRKSPYLHQKTPISSNSNLFIQHKLLPPITSKCCRRIYTNPLGKFLKENPWKITIFIFEEITIFMLRAKWQIIFCNPFTTSPNRSSSCHRGHCGTRRCCCRF